MKKALFPGIIPIEPKHMNRRFLMQKGCFLMPIDTQYSFIENLSLLYQDGLQRDIHPNNIEDLRSVLTLSIEELLQYTILKIIIPVSVQGAMREYLADMNINWLTLFPDTEGLIKETMQPLARFLR